MEQAVHFPPDDRLEEVQIINNREDETPYTPTHDVPIVEKQQPQPPRLSNIYQPPETRIVLQIATVPPLFRCRSVADLRHIIQTGQGSVADVYRGYNLLQWYCNAKSTSPSIIAELVGYGIPIDAVDQRMNDFKGPFIRRTALGIACRNANVKAVHALLKHGANPRGLRKWDEEGVKYPSPVQDLMPHGIHGPRLGWCPWIYHYDESDVEERLERLAEDDPEGIPQFREVALFTGGGCLSCWRDCGIREPWAASDDERSHVWAQQHEVQYSGQIARLGARIRACLRHLIWAYVAREGNTAPPLASHDDMRLWSAHDYLLETVWHFMGPVAACWREWNYPGGNGPELVDCLERIPGLNLAPWGEICDMLVEECGYEGGETTTDMKGQTRLIESIQSHPDILTFRQGEFFGFGRTSKFR